MEGETEQAGDVQSESVRPKKKTDRFHYRDAIDATLVDVPPRGVRERSVVLIAKWLRRLALRRWARELLASEEPLRGRTELLSWHDSARDGQQTFRGLIQINIHPRLR